MTFSNERIGLIGYHCASGLGEKNRQMATYLDIDTWLIKPHKHYPTLPLHEDVDSIICPTGRSIKLEGFLKAVDTVLFDETPYYPNITHRIKEANKRIVCIACMEWMPIEGTPWLKDVDLFICPTRHCYDLYRKELPCIYFPWPVDTQRFQFRERSVCERFLFLNGRGGWKGRKGASVINETISLWPEIPLDIISQGRWEGSTGPNTRILKSPINNANLYKTSDVLVSPHFMDGTGLEQMEAMASGLPVINTDGRPWNELPSIAFINSTVSTIKVKRQIDWHIPSAKHLVEICKSLLNQDIFKESREAKEWADSRSFDKHSSTLNDLIRKGKPE